jgi:H+-transporting ATPase
VIAVLLATVIFVVAIFRGDEVLVVLQFALVLTIAAVPVAMPAVLSVTMALGAGKLAEKQAIVTRLPAVEEVAGVDVLCSDKTGTLTQNKLEPGDPFTVGDTRPEDVILAGALASREEDQDPIDLAVLSGVKKEQQLESYKVVHFQPFDPVHKRTESTAKGKDGSNFKVTKGAPQVILALDPQSDKIKAEVDEAVNRFASRGFRSLGVARAEGEGPWRFLGVIPLSDPLREDSKETVETAESMGLNVKMVTGDQLAIAKEIGSQLGLGGNIIDASAFGDTRHHESGQLADAIEKADGFAQVFPEHKYHIVDVLQQRGHIVGMTGDGVNDAPALKKADAGIAVAGSTDAARAAASIVLLQPGLSVIIDAIRESRKIFQRMTNYAIYRIAETVALLGFLTLAILIFRIYPVTAIMIVLLAILNDGSILSIAYDRTRSHPKPQAWDMRMVLGVSSMLGVYAVFRSFGIFYIGERVLDLAADELRTLVYLNLVVGGILTLYAARVRGPFWSSRPATIMLVATGSAALIGTLLASFGLLMSPIGWSHAGIVWGYCLGLFLVQDRIKILAFKIFGGEHEHSGILAREPA